MYIIDALVHKSIILPLKRLLFIKMSNNKYLCNVPVPELQHVPPTASGLPLHGNIISVSVSASDRKCSYVNQPTDPEFRVAFSFL